MSSEKRCKLVKVTEDTLYFKEIGNPEAEVIKVDSFHIFNTIDYIDLENEKPLSKEFLADFIKE